MQIKIDPRYWSNIKTDYSDWKFAWVREAGQNSIDAGATRVDIATEEVDGHLVVSWADNGRGMTRDILVDKFLAIGGTGKDFKGTTGGWGIAKLILILCHIDFKIETGNLVVSGRNGDYDIIESDAHHDGTRLTVTMEGLEDYDFRYSVNNWVGGTSTACEFYLNGDQVTTAQPANTAKRELEWCHVHEHGNHPNLIHIRINGQLMFTRYTSVKASIVVELKGTNSCKYMTSNRDGMQYEWSSKLDKLIEQIFADPEAIMETDDEDIQVWVGTDGRLTFSDEAEAQERKLAAGKISGMNEPELDPEEKEESDRLDKRAIQMMAVQSMLNSTYSPSAEGAYGVEVAREEKDEIPFMPMIVEGHDLVILNKLNRPIPTEYLPGKMDDEARRLLTKWNLIIKTVGKILGIKGPLATGWVFRSHLEACHARVKDVGNAILLNPIVVVDNEIVPRWDLGWAGFNLLVAAAVHEITHLEYSYHGDGWASAYTHNEAKVNCHRKAINALYSM